VGALLALGVVAGLVEAGQQLDGAARDPTRIGLGAAAVGLR
jgi:hypothetical protein